VSKKCGACKHFEGDPTNLQQGSCCKKPPTIVVPVQGQVVTMFPAVQRTQRCSEHEVNLAVTPV
jgi:hypothetical protein